MKTALICALLFLASACDGTVFSESPIGLEEAAPDARIAGAWKLVDFDPKDADEVIPQMYLHLGTGAKEGVHDGAFVKHRKNGELEVVRLRARLLHRGDTWYGTAVDDEHPDQWMLLRYRLDGPVAQVEWLASEPIAQRVRDGTWPGEINGSGKVKQVVVDGVPDDLFEYLETPEGATAFAPHATFRRL